MSKMVLRVYIPHAAKIDQRSWKHLGQKKLLNRYLMEKAQEAAIGEAQLFEVIAGHLDGDSEHRNDIPDCLDICGREEDLRTFLELYATHLATSTIVWLTPDQCAASPRWAAKG
jgi:hypothetical protein